MSGRGRGNANVEPPLKRSFHTSRGRGRGAGAAGVPPPGVPNAPTRLPVQEFAEPQQPIVEQVEKNVQPPVPTNMGLSYRGRGRGGFDPNPSRAPRNVDPPYCAPLEIRPPADGHGYQEIQAQRDRDYQFDASESGGPAPPYMQQPAHQQYGQPPPQIQPMLLQVAPAYGSGIAGQQGYQHQQPAPAPANPNPFDSHRLAQMFEQVSTLFASMACEMGKMNQNNNGYKI